ncbi:hypothetical protein [Prescottella equi]|uniref:hypothetical protein n=1 Tax=Rhodococcus hoagii TaxID=43767 RepID=UPI00131D5FE1|nr:hypothetical protein [Prescottella equi]
MNVETCERMSSLVLLVRSMSSVVTQLGRFMWMSPSMMISGGAMYIGAASTATGACSAE